MDYFYEDRRVPEVWRPTKKEAGRAIKRAAEAFRKERSVANLQLRLETKFRTPCGVPPSVKVMEKMALRRAGFLH